MARYDAYKSNTSKEVFKRKDFWKRNFKCPLLKSNKVFDENQIKILECHTCGISSKMTATMDLTTIIAMLVASFYRYAALPITCSLSLPHCHEPLTFVTLPSKPLFGYVTAFAQPLL